MGLLGEDYTLGGNPLSFDFVQRDKEIAALKKISLFVSKKMKKIKKIKKQRVDAITKIKNGFKSHVQNFIMKIRVAIKITAAVIATKSRQLRCRSMARKIQKCVRTIYSRHMASKIIQNFFRRSTRIIFVRKQKYKHEKLKTERDSLMACLYDGNKSP